MRYLHLCPETKHPGEPCELRLDCFSIDLCCNFIACQRNIKSLLFEAVDKLHGRIKDFMTLHMMPGDVMSYCCMQAVIVKLGMKSKVIS